MLLNGLLCFADILANRLVCCSFAGSTIGSALYSGFWGGVAGCIVGIIAGLFSLRKSMEKDYLDALRFEELSDDY